MTGVLYRKKIEIQRQSYRERPCGIRGSDDSDASRIASNHQKPGGKDRSTLITTRKSMPCGHLDIWLLTSRPVRK